MKKKLPIKEYSCIQELVANESVKNYSRHSNSSYQKGIIIFTPHGGGIEPGTSEIVTEVASRGFNYFCFEGHGKNCKRLHITSHRFDDEPLFNLLAKHAVAISIHGMSNLPGCIFILAD